MDIRLSPIGRRCRQHKAIHWHSGLPVAAGCLCTKVARIYGNISIVFHPSFLLNMALKIVSSNRFCLFSLLAVSLVLFSDKLLLGVSQRILQSTVISSLMSTLSFLSYGMGI